MKGLNKVQLIGNLGKDPEICCKPEGKQVTKFLRAVNGACKNREGESPQKVGFYTLDILYITIIMYARYIVYILWPVGRG
jgi:single-stranded DNA-binding protein